MQTPEKLSLIGGSILLASTLVFTLKSQASHILPKVDNGMTSLFQSDKDHQTDPQKQQAAQEKQNFDKDYQQAQQKHWQTGTWGTAQFYVDDQGNMHVGSGQLQGSYSHLVDTTKIKSISFDDNTKAPQDSSNLLSLDNNSDDSKNALSQINNLPNLDTSQVTNMSGIFGGDEKLRSLDVSHFDTHNVTDMSWMFEQDYSLSNLDMSHFDTHNVTNMYSMFFNDESLSSLDVSHFDTHSATSMLDMFERDTSLSHLDVSHFDTHNVTITSNMFEGDSKLANLDLSSWDTTNLLKGNDYTGHMFDNALLNNLTLGNNTKLSDTQGWNGTYQSGNQTLSTSQLADNNAHPGTWTKQ